MVNSVATAFSEKSPLVVISGAPGAAESRHGLLLHHQAKNLDSQLQIYKEITCDQAILDNASTAPDEIERVLRKCEQMSRPVYIELPRDMVGVSCASVPPNRPSQIENEAVVACAEEILSRIKEAERPTVLAGVEVRRYDLEDKVAELSNRLGLPVATTFMGRGLLANSDCQLVGTYLGVAGDPEISSLVEHSDALLMLGVILCDTNFGVSSQKIDLRHAFNAADREVHIQHHVYHDIPLSNLLDALLELTSEGMSPHLPGSVPEYARGFERDGEKITPDDIACAVNDFFDRHGPMPMASDVGDCLFTAMEMDNTELVAPGYYATMGFGVPAGLGIQVASGRRPLVLVGDGAFQMTGWELGNCSRYGWDPIVLLFNNSSWEMLAAFHPDSDYTRLSDWHYADMAGSLGGDGVRVHTRSELYSALDAAVSTRGRFQLIEIMLPAGARSKTLDRFVKGVARLSA
jgi:indolepyruvate decarboxylase